MPTAIEYERIEFGVNYDPTTKTLYVEPHRALARCGVRYGSTEPLVFCNLLASFLSAYPEKPVAFVVWVRARSRTVKLPRIVVDGQ